jgi:hypothetical protein
MNIKTIGILTRNDYKQALPKIHNLNPNNGASLLGFLILDEEDMMVLRNVGVH